MNLRSIFGYFSDDLAIDLGTTNILVYARERGIVVNEPSILAVNRRTNTVEAFGHEAKQMVGRTPVMEIKGRYLIEGIPKTMTITDSEVREALSE